MKQTTCIFGLLILMLCAASGTPAETEQKKKDLSKLPEKIHRAAQEFKKDIILTGYNVEDEGDQVIYEVEGTLNGKCYEMEITIEGRILEAEACDQ